ncbi:hypothetical protein BD414DRAFT_537970 [Trametes punicea]|nr:hypothetical protein BD414DRAFT_537970 [Trametes punicea]
MLSPSSGPPDSASIATRDAPLPPHTLVDVIAFPPFIYPPSLLAIPSHHPTTSHDSHAASFTTFKGAIFSAIGAAINAVVSAIAQIIMIIVSVIVTIIVTIFDIIFDIICCNCFGGRQVRTGTHVYRFGRGGGGTY